MRIRVISDLVALGVDTPQEPRRSLGIHADDEERRRHLPRPEYVENLRRILWIRSVVKCERDSWLFASAAGFENIVLRVTLVAFGQLAAGGTPEATDAVRRRLHNAKDLAVSVQADCLAGIDLREATRVRPSPGPRL